MKRYIALLLVLGLLLPLLTAAVRAEQWPGKSRCLMDTATGTVLTAENEHEPLAPASVTKIMTLLLIMEAVDSGQLSWSDSVTASESAAAKGGSQIYLRVGETMTVEDMVKSIAVSSANDCACAMAEALWGSEEAFVRKMNEKAAELGMKDTNFVNCTGLDDGPGAEAHRTSAYDIALMSRELLGKHPDIRKFTTIWMDSVRGGSFGLSNTNKLVRFYPGCTGLKTGYTSGAGFCLSASALREDLELIAVVLGCDSSKDRFDACRRMLDWGFASYTLYTPALSDLEPIPVRLGTLPRLKVVPEGEIRLPVPKSDISRITLRSSLPEQLTAPISQGSQIGFAEILLDGRVIRRIPLTAAEDCGRVGFSDLLRMLLGHISMCR